MSFTSSNSTTMRPHDWLFVRQCAETFGEVLAQFRPIQHSNPSVTSERAIEDFVYDSVFVALLQKASTVTLIESNFDDHSFGGLGREIKAITRPVGDDLEFIKIEEYSERFRDFWLNRSRGHSITRGKVLLQFEDHHNDLEGILSLATSFAISADFRSEIGGRLAHLQSWLKGDSKRVAVFTSTKTSMVILATPRQMWNLLESYENKLSVLNLPGSTLDALKAASIRATNLFEKNLDRVFPA